MFRRITVSTAIAICITLSSVAQPVAQASASASTTVLTIPASIQIGPATRALIETCLGEAVTFVGEAVLVVHRTTLPDGSRLFVVHANPQGAVAVGASSGITYRLAASDTFVQVVAPSDAFVVTSDANLHVIGPGTAAGFFGHVLFHLTVTPEGEITAAIDIIDIQCV